MTPDVDPIDRPVEDAVSNVLKWVLLATAILTVALLAWATTATYRPASPQPERFVGADGTILMTDDDIGAGNGGFQKADLMDYGSLAYARSRAFYDTTLFWQWMRLPGDVVFAAGALPMAWDFIVKLLRPLFPQAVARLVPWARVKPATVREAP